MRSGGESHPVDLLLLCTVSFSTAVPIAALKSGSVLLNASKLWLSLLLNASQASELLLSSYSFGRLKELVKMISSLLVDFFFFSCDNCLPPCSRLCLDSAIHLRAFTSEHLHEPLTTSPGIFSLY